MSEGEKLPVDKALDKLRGQGKPALSKKAERAGKTSDLNAEIRRLRAQRIRLGGDPARK